MKSLTELLVVEDTFYDQPHVFRPPMQDEALDWPTRWL